MIYLLFININITTSSFTIEYTSKIGSILSQLSIRAPKHDYHIEL